MKGQLQQLVLEPVLAQMEATGIRIDTAAGGSELRRWFGSFGSVALGHPANLGAFRYLKVTLSGPACLR